MDNDNLFHMWRQHLKDGLFIPMAIGGGNNVLMMASNDATVIGEISEGALVIHKESTRYWSYNAIEDPHNYLMLHPR